MKEKRFDVYDILDAMYANGLIQTSFEIDGNKVIDSSNLRPLFCLQADEKFDVMDSESCKLANDNVYSNYIRLESDDDSSILQFWGKPKRGTRGEVIIEIRKKLYDRLECDNVKIFRESRHEIYKKVEQHRLIVVDNTSDAIKVVKAFIERLDKKRSNASEETTATKKDNAQAV